MSAVLDDITALVPSGALTGSSVPQMADSRTSAFAARGVVVVIASSALVAGCLSGTVVPASWRPQHEPLSTDVGAGLGLLTTAATAPAAAAVVATGEARRSSKRTEAAASQEASKAGIATLSDQEEVLWLKNHSGLTWDQLGRVFGVSRRAVHLWANGGRMNEGNAAVLREFSRAVRSIAATEPDAVRAALLAVPAEGYSVVDNFRRRHAAGDSPGQPFAVHELLGALSDEPPIHT
ncbi:hypothetical protein [Cellulomonas sp. PS-H5]|uniref:hypothetical protein n=1 Tax=Cellulomonas sp. PS-H5 TaxID=2820400 RepID=UPI001C500676|nr:hypothetical protein [Cellulomonas sp. PS-H5]MBW0255865.1 hypothetical protein [Cellulomonas sp. PS-H5]